MCTDGAKSANDSVTEANLELPQVKHAPLSLPPVEKSCSSSNQTGRNKQASQPESVMVLRVKTVGCLKEASYWVVNPAPSQLRCITGYEAGAAWQVLKPLMLF